MKWLIAHPGPGWSVHDVYVGWCEALRDAGQQVARYNLDDRIAFYSNALMPTPWEGTFRRALSPDQAVERAAAGIYEDLYTIRPDVLMVISGFFLPPAVYTCARRAGVRIVVVHTEEPYEHDRQLRLAELADVNLIDDPTNLAAFQAVSTAAYFPHTYRPGVHTPGPVVPDLACDLGFVGTGYPSRVAFFESMDLTGLDVVLAGNWQGLAEDSPLRPLKPGPANQCLDNVDAVHLYRSMRCGINLYRAEATGQRGRADGVAISPREVEMAACGAFFCRQPRAEGDEVLDMLPTFAGPGEAGELLRWYLDHPGERQARAAKARAAIADRTFDNQAAALLRLLDQ
jgi:spore maturation protein CgeB